MPLKTQDVTEENVKKFLYMFPMLNPPEFTSPEENFI